MILNPWDVQSKQIHTTDGIASTLYAGMCRWGGNEMYILVKRENEKDIQYEQSNNTDRKEIL